MMRQDMISATSLSDLWYTRTGTSSTFDPWVKQYSHATRAMLWKAKQNVCRVLANKLEGMLLLASHSPQRTTHAYFLRIIPRGIFIPTSMDGILDALRQCACDTHGVAIEARSKWPLVHLNWHQTNIPSRCAIIFMSRCSHALYTRTYTSRSSWDIGTIVCFLC